MYTCFKNRTALITGGGSGIGAAIAKELAKFGANIAVVDRDLSHAESVAADITARGGAAMATEADVANPTDTKTMVQKTVAQFGALHYAVNSAGINGEMVPTAERTEASWRRTLSINLDGVHYSMRYELPAILEAGGGAIVNISSVYSVVGLEDNAAYTAAKAGVSGLTRAVALEYAAKGVRVNTLSPGPIRTPLTEKFPEVMDAVCRALPTGRAGLPQEMAPIAVFMLSDKASQMIGAEVLADSAKSIA